MEELSMATDYIERCYNCGATIESKRPDPTDAIYRGLKTSADKQRFLRDQKKWMIDWSKDNYIFNKNHYENCVSVLVELE